MFHQDDLAQNRSRQRDWKIASVLLFIHAILLAYSGYIHSPTVDEPAQMVAGLQVWRHGRFDLYQVNPPLVRLVATLPIMCVDHNEDWSDYMSVPGARPEFRMGENFVNCNGERSYWLFTLGRWACIPFSVLGGLVCFLWARDLYGQCAGLIACSLWCFSPNVLGHSALMLTDAQAASMCVASCWCFWKWLCDSTWKWTIIAGCVLGLAALTKTTLVLLYPLFPLLWLMYRWPIQLCLRQGEWFRQLAKLSVLFVLSLYVLNLGYGFQGSGKSIQSFYFVSRLLNSCQKLVGGRVSEAVTPLGAVSSDQMDGNGGLSWLGRLPCPLPEHYILGIDLQQRDFEGSTFDSFLGGKWQKEGWWYYYIYAATIKEPVSTLLLFAIVIGLSVRRYWPKSRLGDEFVLLAPAVLIFTVASMKYGFSHHLHYVLPSYPFVFIWIGKTGLLVSELGRLNHGELPHLSHVRPRKRSDWVFKYLVVTLTALSCAASLWNYPHCLSYFNMLVGGPKRGHEHLLNSNIDWGQDLLILKKWAERHATNQPLYLAYFGMCEPVDVGFPNAKAWPGKIHGTNKYIKGNDAKSVEQLEPGYYAISINLLSAFPWPARGGSQRGGVDLSPDIVAYFGSQKPIARAGYSIVIYAHNLQGKEQETNP